MHRLTEKNVVFKWTPECTEAFQKLKQALTTSPILIYPSLDKEFILDTDASGTGVGAVLSQIGEDGKEHVIAYYSKTLSKTERQYCVTRRELLAVIMAVKHFHHYLYGVHFLIRTDHGALTWLTNFKNPEGQLARWLEILGTYNYTIKHRAGLRHGNADGLSRRPCRECNHCEKRENHDQDLNQDICQKTRAIRTNESDETEPSEISTNWVDSKSHEELKQSQEADPILKTVIQWLNSATKPKWQDISHLDKTHKAYWAQWDRFTIVNGILYRKWINTTTSDHLLQYVLPSCFRNEVLKALHDDPLAGHMGVKRTIARVRYRFYWVGYQAFVERYCQRCIECQKRKGPSQNTRAAMKTYVVGETMDRVALDILGPVPQTYNGNKYLLVITDYFTRYAEAYALPNINASTVAEKMVTEFICRYGVPTQVHTDQGAQFTSDLFVELCKMLHIDKTRNSPFHPQSSGLVEKLNGTIEDMLSKFVTKNQRDWDTYLPFIMLAYRSAPHDTLGESPNLMMFGREVQIPVDLVFGKQHEAKSVPDYVDHLFNRMDRVHNIARDRLIKAADRQKRRYDLTCKTREYKTGDGVMLRDTRKYKGRSPKLQFKWEGPFTVIKVISDVLYQIQEGPKTKSKIVHTNRLKPYKGYMKRWYQPPGEPALNTRGQTKDQ